MLKTVAPFVDLRTVVWEKKSLAARVRMFYRRGRRGGWLRLVDRALLALYSRVKLRRRAAACPEWTAMRNARRDYQVGCREARVPTVNDPRVIELLRQNAPDLVLVWGTGIIREHVLQAAPFFVNVHAGITPLYRGAHGGVWAVIHEDFGNVGVTVHRVDRGIDTGMILKQVKITLDPDSDTMTTLQAKQTVAGAKALAQWIAENTPPFGRSPVLQGPPGKSKFFYSPGLRDYRRFENVLKTIRGKKHNATPRQVAGMIQ
jgi:folate-dependent phosphoribosylglycinamide formyltransferase PurN